MIETDMGYAIPMLRGLLMKIESPTVLMEALGDMAVEEVKERIMETKESPTGVPWAPWHNRTERDRSKKGNTSQGLLWDTGALLNSIHYEVSGYDLLIKADVPYAEDLQIGTNLMAGRPFMGWDPRDYGKIRNIARNWLRAMY